MQLLIETTCTAGKRGGRSRSRKAASDSEGEASAEDTSSDEEANMHASAAAGVHGRLCCCWYAWAPLLMLALLADLRSSWHMTRSPESMDGTHTTLEFGAKPGRIHIVTSTCMRH